MRQECEARAERLATSEAQAAFRAFAAGIQGIIFNCQSWFGGRDGLLTATIPTKIGGDMNFIAREMKFQFYRPVFAGDTITCACTVVEFEPVERYTNVRTEFVCRNQDGKEVMTGQAFGVVRG